MCLAIPARIEELTTPGNAIVNLGGVRKEISLALVEICVGIAAGTVRYAATSRVPCHSCSSTNLDGPGRSLCHPQLTTSGSSNAWALRLA